MPNAKTVVAFVIVTAVAMVLLWNYNLQTVKAQARPALAPGASVAAACSVGSTTAVNAGGTSFPWGGDYPVFACLADLDGTGQHQVIIGFVASTPSYTGMNEVYKVAIINPNGTIRADVPVN